MKALIANLGFIFQIAGLLMVIPIVTAHYYSEQEPMIAFLITSLSFFSAGFLMNALSERKELDYKTSCLLVLLTFVLISLLGTIPYFYLKIFNSQNILEDFINSYFESVSGFTTTGLTFLDSKDLPKSLVLYRSLTQWIGGIGIVYLILAFFYEESIANGIAEAIGIKKFLTKIKSSIIEVLFIYSFYTLFFFSVLYFLGIKDFVTNISLVFSGLSTGGFMPSVDANPQIIISLIAIMIIGATSFEIHHALIFRKWHRIKFSEILTFLILIIIATLAFYYLYPSDIISSLFKTVSATTTTGFAFESIGNIPETLKLIFIALMFIGGCTFSTSGGIKVYRLIFLFKSIEIAVKEKLGMENKEDTKEALLSLLTISLSILIVFISAFIFTLHDYPFVDSLFQCVSAYSTSGLSLNLNLNATLKSILIALMIVGRVEIFTFLVAISKYKQSKNL
jgi:trk system potassium uptake protein TrkH